SPPPQVPVRRLGRRRDRPATRPTVGQRRAERPGPDYSNPSLQGCRPRASSPSGTPLRRGPAPGGIPPPYPHPGKSQQRAVQRISQKDGGRESGGGHAGARTPGDTTPGAASSMTAAPRSAAYARRLPPPP